MPLKSPSVHFPNNRQMALESQRRRFLSILRNKREKLLNTWIMAMHSKFPLNFWHPALVHCIWYIWYQTKKDVYCFWCQWGAWWGQRLNKQLLTGPDVNSSLIGVLCKFCIYDYCFAADIAQMFSRIRTCLCDSDSFDIFMVWKYQTGWVNSRLLYD